MGKILQGTLLEAYGQLQTQRTRIAPFLDKKLIRPGNVARSSRTFCPVPFGRVLPIDCNWITNTLPEIQAANRPSIISPSEDAKEKLAKYRQVAINPQTNSTRLKYAWNLQDRFQLKELKQAFQLLDISPMDDDVDR
ncbi:LOW QUALITY PROTEIN: hypothetical protein DAPPUDRAFT_249880 [Daphnia pulex]|uniref:Uncharacterized protein n=1 Tax=Daphnia pulex TaxID=6669 RepID=E9GXF8_DAPPU|nr:LOW QUALITY PROTEIN: hypothetical protein DAPPUDRAFT_249880 [Daphnia pulex]|eukprot:EFX75862.1 LOW QUALITY PROTEIN: hypothetical protein DAPPUDRAFT_249880 [Daphnia pulex]